MERELGQHRACLDGGGMGWRTWFLWLRKDLGNAIAGVGCVHFEERAKNNRMVETEMW